MELDSVRIGRASYNILQAFFLAPLPTKIITSPLIAHARHSLRVRQKHTIRFIVSSFHRKSQLRIILPTPRPLIQNNAPGHTQPLHPTCPFLLTTTQPHARRWGGLSKILSIVVSSFCIYVHSGDRTSSRPQP